MANTVDKQSSRTDYNYREFILDTIADLDDVIVETCSSGSTCFFKCLYIR